MNYKYRQKWNSPWSIKVMLHPRKDQTDLVRKWNRKRFFFYMDFFSKKIVPGTNSAHYLLRTLCWQCFCFSFKNSVAWLSLQRHFRVNLCNYFCYLFFRPWCTFQMMLFNLDWNTTDIVNCIFFRSMINPWPWKCWWYWYSKKLLVF